jgi:hypothetical protein
VYGCTPMIDAELTCLRLFYRVLAPPPLRDHAIGEMPTASLLPAGCRQVTSDFCVLTSTVISAGTERNPCRSLHSTWLWIFAYTSHHISYGRELGKINTYRHWMWHSDSVNKWAIKALVSRHRIRIAIKDKTRRQFQFSLSQASNQDKERSQRYL